MGERPERADLSVAIGPLAAPVLGRVARAMAAKADLPFNRVSDATLIADAIAAHAPAAALDGHVRVNMEAGARRLELRVGPFEPGGARSVLEASALPEVGPVLERLADEVRVAADAGDGVEHLIITLRAA
jgi:hypothetical protein